MDSLEWRLYAFLITGGILLINGHSLWEVFNVSLQLQAVLFIGHTIWLYNKRSV